MINSTIQHIKWCSAFTVWSIYSSVRFNSRQRMSVTIVRKAIIRRQEEKTTLNFRFQGRTAA